MSIEISQAARQREKKEQNIQEILEYYKRYNICIMQTPEGDERKQKRNNSWEFSIINDRHQVTDPRSSEDVKRDKYPKIIHLSMSYSNCRNQRIRENTVRSQRGKTPYL